MFVTKPIISDRRIRFAVVGCGRISKNHFEAFKQHSERARLAAICDIDPAALDRAANLTGAPAFRNLGALLKDSDADVIVLATPSGLHAAQPIEIARAGASRDDRKTSSDALGEDGKRMVRACDEAGVRLFVIKQNRRNATLQLLKRAMDKERLGRICGRAQRVLVASAVIL